MIVVSDSTPLISLMKIGRLDLLNRLFGEVSVPEAVFYELTSNDSFHEEAQLVKDSSFIKVVSVSDRARVSLIRRATGLDLGESEAIIYADEVKADVLLMDEAKGRQVAQNMNLPLAGSMGVLVMAFKSGLLTTDEINEALCRMKESGRHISDRLVNMVLKAVQDRSD